jgi:hypothetical protein
MGRPGKRNKLRNVGKKAAAILTVLPALAGCATAVKHNAIVEQHRVSVREPPAKVIDNKQDSLETGKSMLQDALEMETRMGLPEANSLGLKVGAISNSVLAGRILMEHHPAEAFIAYFNAYKILGRNVSPEKLEHLNQVSRSIVKCLQDKEQIGRLAEILREHPIFINNFNPRDITFKASMRLLTEAFEIAIKNNSSDRPTAHIIFLIGRKLGLKFDRPILRF